VACSDFPWYKYFLTGLSQTANMMPQKAELGKDASNTLYLTGATGQHEDFPGSQDAAKTGAKWYEEA
jgi:hypothetical protein